MVSSRSTTVAEYLADLPPERRDAVSAVRALVRKNLPKGFEEAMDFGMITWAVPLSRYPVTYNKRPLMIAALAAQKNAISLYLMGVYSNEDVKTRFEKAYARSGKKLDMGKSCLRFKTLDEVAVDAVAEALRSTDVDAFVAHYEASRSRPTKATSTPKSQTKAKAPAKTGAKRKSDPKRPK